MAKKPDPKDWHKEDIKAAVRKLGTSFKGLAIANGYRSVDAVNQALFRPYPKAERIISRALDLSPETIWPSRYKGEFNDSKAQRNTNLMEGKKHAP